MGQTRLSICSWDKNKNKYNSIIANTDKTKGKEKEKEEKRKNYYQWTCSQMQIYNLYYYYIIIIYLNKSGQYPINGSIIITRYNFFLEIS